MRLKVVCSLVHSGAECGETVLLSHGFVILHEQHVCVVVRNESREQLVLPLILLSGKDVHGELHNSIAACGVSVGSEQFALVDELHAAAFLRHGVDAAETNLADVYSVLLACLACAHCHAVVMCEDA